MNSKCYLFYEIHTWICLLWQYFDASSSPTDGQAPIFEIREQKQSLDYSHEPKFDLFL